MNPLPVHPDAARLRRRARIARIALSALLLLQIGACDPTSQRLLEYQFQVGLRRLFVSLLGDVLGYALV